MTKTMTGVAWVLVTMLAASAAGGQWDKKTIEKMLKDGAVAQKDSVLEGSLTNAIAEVTGKQSPNRYKCP